MLSESLADVDWEILKYFHVSDRDASMEHVQHQTSVTVIMGTEEETVQSHVHQVHNHFN